MSYNGELSNKPTKIDMPNISSTDGYSNFSLQAGNGTTAGRPFWITNDRIHTFEGGTGKILFSNIDDPANLFDLGYSSVFGQSGILPTFGYPFPIDGYVYAFNTIIDSNLTSPTGTIYRSSSLGPPAFASQSFTLATGVTNAMVYVDATYIWVIGGLSGSATATNVIQRCTRANPTVWSNVGTLPINRSNAALAVVGANIYMYGGINESGAATNTIYTATTANPLVWTNTGSTLPTTTYNGAIYNDGSNIYLLGAVGPTVSNDILRATIATPASMSKVGSMATGSSVYAYAKDGVIYSIGSAAFANTGSYVEKALVSSPLSWSQQINGLVSQVTAAGTMVHNGSIYVIGGNASNGAPTANVQMASINQPMNFANVGTLPASTSGGQIVKTSTKAYLLGANGTTGNVYEAPLTNLSTGWTLSTLVGPARNNGRVFVYRNNVFYVGGETSTSASTAFVGRATIENGNLNVNSWQSSARWQSSNFPSVSRFALIVANQYVYVIGGHTDGTASNGVWRAKINDLLRITSGGATNVPYSWNKVATITTTVIDPVVVMINNKAFIMGGSSTTVNGVPQRTIISASMTDLSNGVVSFSYEGATDVDGTRNFPYLYNSSGYSGVSASTPICAKNTVYMYDSRISSGSFGFAFKTQNHTRYNLVGNNGLSNGVPQLVVGDDGTLGSISYFQKNGMLPWHVSEY